MGQLKKEAREAERQANLAVSRAESARAALEYYDPDRDPISVANEGIRSQFVLFGHLMLCIGIYAGASLVGGSVDDEIKFVETGFNSLCPNIAIIGYLALSGKNILSNFKKNITARDATVRTKNGRVYLRGSYHPK